MSVYSTQSIVSIQTTPREYKVTFISSVRRGVLTHSDLVIVYAYYDKKLKCERVISAPAMHIMVQKTGEENYSLPNHGK